MEQFVYSDEHIRTIINLKRQNYTWNDICKELKNNFGLEKTPNAVAKTYKRYKDYNVSNDEMLKNIQATYSARKKNSKLSKEVRLLAETLNTKEDIIEEIRNMILSLDLPKVSIAKPSANKNKTELAIEVLISDIHIGIKTKSTDTEITQQRVRKVTEVAIEEYERHSKNFNVVKFQVLLNGDIIQGNKLHPDSSESCETTDAEQMADAIKILFYDVVLPLAQVGIQVDVVGVCGNHDRQGKDRPIVNPGKNYLTYTIYKSMEMLCEASKLKNVSWNIPEEEYAIYEMFGHHFLVEHGHASGIKPNAQSLERQLLKRSNLVGQILKGIRIGHFHEPLIGGVGRFIVNGSSVSDDHYGASLGYKSYPCQMINFYVNTHKRDTSYYYSFPVNLSEI